MIASSLDFLHSAFARAQHDPSGDAIGFATAILAGVLFPSVLGAAGAFSGAVLSGRQAVLVAPFALLVAAGYARLRRVNLANLRASSPLPLSQRARLIAVAFAFSAGIGSALVARMGWWQGLAVLLLVAALPWATWGRVGAP